MYPKIHVWAKQMLSSSFMIVAVLLNQFSYSFSRGYQARSTVVSFHAIILSGSSPVVVSLWLKYFIGWLKGQKLKINLTRIKLLISHLDLCNEFIRIFGITMTPLPGLKHSEKRKSWWFVSWEQLNRLSFQYDVPDVLFCCHNKILVFGTDLGWCAPSWSLALIWVGAHHPWCQLAISLW